MSNWTLLSNHGHVLVCLERDNEARLRDVAMNVGITERAVQKIVRDLQLQGMVSITKQGRRNRYQIHHQEPLRHTLEAHCTIGELVKIVNQKTKLVDRLVAQTPAQPDSIQPPPVSTPSQADTVVIPEKKEALAEAETKSKESPVQKQQGSLF
jgi:predicted transcriptional regulator